MRIRKTAPKEFTIDRSKWVHGDNTKILGSSLLLNEEENMCCLGFYSRACGFTKAAIEYQSFHIGSPRILPAFDLYLLRPSF